MPMPRLIAPGGIPTRGPNSSGSELILLAPGVLWRPGENVGEFFGDQYVFLFGMGERKLTAVQRRKIAESVIPLLTPAGSWAEFYAIADRTGTPAQNYRVTADRLSDFQMTCMAAGGPFDLIWGTQHKYFGEDFAKDRKRPDEVEEASQRAVVAFIWPSISAAARVLFRRDDGEPNPLLAYGRSHPQP